jgi:hypothetical protein
MLILWFSLLLLLADKLNDNVMMQKYGCVLTSVPEPYPDLTGSVIHWPFGSGSLLFYQRLKEISEKKFNFLNFGIQ